MAKRKNNEKRKAEKYRPTIDRAVDRRTTATLSTDEW